MIKRLLTESELAEIAEALDDPEFKERLERRPMAVRRHGLGVANSKIAGILRVSDDTVTNYLKLYPDEGLAGRGGDPRPRLHQRADDRLGKRGDHLRADFQDRPRLPRRGDHVGHGHRAIPTKPEGRRDRRDTNESLGIELLYLPTYSPNLELIERVGRLVKGKCPGNRYHETFTLFVGAIDEFPDSLNGKNSPLLKSLVTENFQWFEIPKT